MILNDLIKVIDVDSKIMISENGKDLFDGIVLSLQEGETQSLKPGSFEKEVKSIWFSAIYNRIIIEI